MTKEEDLISCDIAEGNFFSREDFVQNRVLGGSPPGPRRSGFQAPQPVWRGAQAGVGAPGRSAPAPGPASDAQTVTSFLLAVRRCWGR